MRVSKSVTSQSLGINALSAKAPSSPFDAFIVLVSLAVLLHGLTKPSQKGGDRRGKGMLMTWKYGAILLLLKLPCVYSARRHVEHLSTTICQLPDTRPVWTTAPALTAWVCVGQMQLTSAARWSWVYPSDDPCGDVRDNSSTKSWHLLRAANVPRIALNPNCYSQWW